MPSQPWSSLLEDEDAEQAREIPREIAKSIADRHARLGEADVQEGDRRPWIHGSLGEGTAGLSLFFAYLASETGRTDSRRLAEELADAAVDRLAESSSRMSLYGGFAGTAWLIRHLGALWEDPNAASYTEDIDRILLRALSQDGWNADYDLISGLVGFGTYALECGRSPEVVQCVERIVEHLDRLAEWTEAGVTWFTPPRLLDGRAREACPSGYYNLGVAHGVPGVIVFLSRAAQANIAKNAAERLSSAAVEWLLAQKLAPGSPSVFSRFVVPGGEQEASRLAWCYGDAGIAAALSCAAESLNVSSWRRAALEIATHSAARVPASAKVIDGGLCHGAAGVAHMFNRMFQTSGETVLRDAAVAWYRRLFAFRESDVGVGGYRAWIGVSDEPGAFKLEDRIGFLTGAAGIGLALIAATSTHAPEWDRVMLLSTALPTSSATSSSGDTM